MTRRLQLISGVGFFALLFIYAGALAYLIYSPLAPPSDPGWLASQRGNSVVIERVNPDGPATGLRPGDRIISINGQRIEDLSQMVETFKRIRPESVYEIVVSREGRLYEYRLRTDPIPVSAISAAAILILIIFLLTGFIVFLLKPTDKQAVLLSLMFGTFFFAASAAEPSLAGFPLWLTIVMVTVNIISSICWPVILHFFLIFPEPSPILRKYPRLERYLYLPHLLIIFPYLATLNLLAAFEPSLTATFRNRFSAVDQSLTVIFVLYTAAGLMSLLINYRQASLASRRKMRVVVAGCIAGFLPMFIFLGLAFLFDLTNTNPTLSLWLTYISIFAFPLFPLSFAYAIVRHQVIPIRLILRRSVRYLLVSRGFIIVQSAVLFGVPSFLLTGERIAAIDRVGARADIVVTMAATALAIVALTIVNQRVMPLIDRRFFREAYDAQKILSDLGQEMRTVTTVEQLLSLATAKIQDALHIENVTIFLRDDESGDYICAISSHLAETGMSTSDADRRLLLPCQGFVAERMLKAQQPLEIDYRDPKPLKRTLGLDDTSPNEAHQRERDMLRRIDSALLLPVAMKDQLLGIVSLGPRLGDLPFSREDKQLLQAVAWQMAFAIQNSQLVEQIAEEERLRHELDIATAVQRRLFPDRPPDVGRLDLSGLCLPARGVGGDYYDFIMLEQGKVGIAVADVAGKGISAALLMSTVQASLRSQAPSVNGRLIELVSSMNRLLHISTDSNSFASFFYAQFDEETSVLTYVNAGHNPPILFRAEPAAKAQSAGQTAIALSEARIVATEIADESDQPGISLLTTGGPVIGAFHTSVYQQEEIRMYSGDLLVAYTDGVTEAFNREGEEFEESRLRTIISASAQLSAQELTEKIVASVRDWCSDTPQHDDLTLVVMKVH